jgi:hypothetical protein
MRTPSRYLRLARRLTALRPDPWRPLSPTRQDYDQVLTQLRKDSP